MSGARRSFPLLALLVAIVVPFLAKDLLKPARPAQGAARPAASPASSGREAAAPRPATPRRVVPASSREDGAVEVNEEHLFSGQINRRGKPVGFHSRPGGHDPGTARLVERLDGPNAAGVYTAEVEILDSRSGRWLRKTSTFYPDRMDRAQVLGAVRNAFAQRREGSEKFRGPSGAGFTIEGYFQEGRINTAYPIYSRR